MKAFYQTFQVAGTYLFPADMLRYDQAYPATSIDASKINSVNESSSPTSVVITLKRVVFDKSAMPNALRWVSFGWTVIPDSIQVDPVSA